MYTLIILSISGILFSGFTQVITSQIRYANKKVTHERALHVAEAGIYFYRWYLAHQVEGRTKQQIDNFWQNGSPYGVGTAYVADYEGIGQYTIQVTPPSGNSTIAIVEVSGYLYKDPSRIRTIRVRFRQPSWSEFSVLCDSDIRFGNGTEVHGPIHSNGGIRFDGVAHNTVSSARQTYDDPDVPGVNMRDGVWTSWANEYNTSMGSSVFLGGKEFPITGPNFNGVTGDLVFMKTSSGCATSGSYCADSTSNGNYYFDNDRLGRHIVFNANGTMSVRKVKTVTGDMEIGSYQGAAVNYAIPNNGIIFVEDDVWVEGRVNGRRVAVVAADISGGTQKSIYLRNDLLYTQYDQSEVIGLVAQNNIDVTRNSENDLRIDAALLAQNGRVGRPHYGDHKDTITVFGSIATRGRYGFSYTDGTGYTNRDLIYDNNFLYAPPPFFPTGTHYAIDLWQEI